MHESNNSGLASATINITSAVFEAEDGILASSMTAAQACALPISTFSTVVKNQGTVAAGAFRVSFYLSTDSTITTGRAHVCSPTTLSLRIPSSTTYSRPVTIYSFVTPGTYYVGAIADDQGQLHESD